MALTVKGSAVALVTRNGNILNAVSVKGTNVWTYTSQPSSDWVTKTGSFIVMTSNSAPSPFKASIENSYGSYSVSSSNYYYPFDNKADGALTITATKSSGSTQNGYIGIKCSFGKVIKVQKMSFQGSSSGTREIHLIKDGTSVYSLKNSEIKAATTTYTVADIECDSVILSVRATVQGATSQMNAQKFQITQWQELEVWSPTTGTLGQLQKSGSYGGNNSSAYHTGTVNFGKSVKISTLSLYTKITRTDISGRQDGRIVVYGVKSDGTKVKIADKTNQWTTSSVASSDKDTVFTGVYYEFWLTDNIQRGHSVEFNAYISQWYEQS